MEKIIHIIFHLENKEKGENIYIIIVITKTLQTFEENHVANGNVVFAMATPYVLETIDC